MQCVKSGTCCKSSQPLSTKLFHGRRLYFYTVTAKALVLGKLRRVGLEDVVPTSSFLKRLCAGNTVPMLTRFVMAASLACSSEASFSVTDKPVDSSMMVTSYFRALGESPSSVSLFS